MIQILMEETLTVEEQSFDRLILLNLIHDYKNVKIGVQREGKIVKVLTYQDLETGRSVPEGFLIHSVDIFEKALEIFRGCEDREGLCLPVFSEDSNDILYLLQYSKNRVDATEKGYVGEFLEYDIENPFIDYDLLSRADVYFFYGFEEYTYQIARIILRKYPGKKVFFQDARANLFFSGNEDVVITTIGEAYLNYPEFRSKSVLMIDSDKLFGPYDVRKVLNKHYHSLQVMTSLFWSCKRVELGQEYPEKTFYWIHCPLGNDHGFVDLIKYPLYKAVMAIRKGMIPVIDLSVEGDKTHYSNTGGENVWEFYMKQPTSATVEDIKKAKNIVVCDECIMERFNPYNMEVEYMIQWRQMLKEYFFLNEETSSYVENQYHKFIPGHLKVLGVVAYSDKENGIYDGSTFMTNADFIRKVEEIFQEKNYDKIFLNAKNEDVYQMFLGSKVGGHVIAIPQHRMDSSVFWQNGEKLSVDKIIELTVGEEDLKERERRYFSILYILSKCQGLVSSGSNGATRMAQALRETEYEDLWIYNG